MFSEQHFWTVDRSFAFFDPAPCAERIFYSAPGTALPRNFFAFLPLRRAWFTCSLSRDLDLFSVFVLTVFGTFANVLSTALQYAMDQPGEPVSNGRYRAPRQARLPDKAKAAIGVASSGHDARDRKYPSHAFIRAQGTRRSGFGFSNRNRRQIFENPGTRHRFLAPVTVRQS